MTAAARRRLVFVTGKLAAAALKRIVSKLAEEVGFDAEVFVAKISVAALMTPDWLAGKLKVAPDTDQVILPGLCKGDLGRLAKSLGSVPVVHGPDDLRDLPEFFHRPPREPLRDDVFDIEILAEINHANRLPAEQLFAAAESYRESGADVIDLGCTPGEPWSEIGPVTAELVKRGFRISVDSFDAVEVANAAAAGAELVLSVNSSNCRQAKDWDCEVVAIPDHHERPGWFRGLRRTAEILEKDGVPFRVDPILDPIGFGFAASLDRYLKTRSRMPAAKILMGIGNLTELTQVDSAGVNAVLIGFCQELGIQSVLTTEVINWARSSVREIAVARVLMKHAVDERVLPKRLDGRLVMLRDERLNAVGADELARLQRQIVDRNFRLFAEEGQLTVMNRDVFEQGKDAFELFDRLGVTDPSHAFYLGWEMMKAATALQLGKRYVQDQALRWGMLTRDEVTHWKKKRREDSP